MDHYDDEDQSKWKKAFRVPNTSYRFVEAPIIFDELLDCLKFITSKSNDTVYVFKKLLAILQ